jgi:hypothetical protein
MQDIERLLAEVYTMTQPQPVIINASQTRRCGAGDREYGQGAPFVINPFVALY